MKTIFHCKTKQIAAAIIASLFFFGCKVPYDPSLKTAGDRFLIVEGYININGVATNIKLSRTRNITNGDTAAYLAETGATVIIEDNQNNVYPLYETGDGNYSASYNLSSGNQYRIHITTEHGEEYLSDFVKPKESPPIDDVGWQFKDGNVQVFLDTHDPANQTKYYRWDYEETWEFHSQYYSTLVFNPASNGIDIRTVPVYVCYRTKNSTNIFIGSTAKLQQDVIHQTPLDLIENHDRRISVLYSINVTQYALDTTAYNYWSGLKANTENVGSIFDPQPNENVGNIHSVKNPFERVIGYISAGSTQQKRLFIPNADMPPGWNQPGNCTEIRATPDSVVFYFGDNVYIPYETDPPGSPRPNAYFGASASCVDCTLSGTPVKPSFWP